MIKGLLKNILFLLKPNNKTTEIDNNYTSKKIVSHNCIFCDRCNGNYIIREGKHGIFAGCINYPKCTSTINVYEFVLKYIIENGINIYKWNRICWRCKKLTHVYSYYLNYELEKYDEYFSYIHCSPGLGDLGFVDNYMSRKFKTIKIKYSNTTKTHYMANCCAHCDALQGKNYIVDDPHEIMDSLIFKKDMEKYKCDTFVLNEYNNGFIDLDGYKYDRNVIIKCIKSYYNHY